MDINLLAPINVVSYGYCGLNILENLIKLGHRVAYFPIGQTQAASDKVEMIRTAYQNADTYNNYAPSLRIWHQFDLAEHVGKGLHAGFPIFELDTFSKRERHHIEQLDVVFVASQWAKEVVQENIHHMYYEHRAPVFVAPLGVDRTIFHENLAPVREKVEGQTIFMNVGKWEIRKGHDVLLEAFNDAFSETDDVQLWMAPVNFHIGEKGNQEWAELYKTSRLGDKIFLLDRCDTQQQLARVMATADVGVFPSRAEGFNLELLEMMSLGKPCIATYNTGHTEYANLDNCTLIETPDMEDAYDGIFFHNQGQWYAMGREQHDQLVYAFRKQHEQNIGFQAINDEGIKTAKQYSWESTARNIVKGIQ